MTDYPEIAARFARDTAKHEMTVLHDDGLYRHLRFAQPGHGSIGAFELITWPYNLVVKAGWVFHFDIDATPDMFDLFRRTALTGQINPGYWSEKVRAGRDEAEGFSVDLLEKEIEETVRNWVDSDLDRRIANRAGVDDIHRLPSDVRKAYAKEVDADWQDFTRQLRCAVNEHFFDGPTDYNIEFESEAYRALHEFTFRPEGQPDHELPWQFDDFSEWRLKSYTPGFLHSCHAIRHGIDLYDAASTKAVAA
ncbi:hypothetical protein ABZ383_27420 [Streptomyces sp. NPDC005900]|uniref:hypothetical protein n=1 Tax=Streptomyces sp. NPDC005900 TaxID=3154569 RepID=UPI0033ED2E14